MKIKGSKYYDPAVRAREIAEQVQEALWAAHRAGVPVPSGPLEISFSCDSELTNLKQFVFGGQAR